MSEAAFGIPDWLPARSRQAMAAEEAAAARAAKQAEADLETRREQARDASLSLYRSQAEGRGEVVSAMALARGEVGGRTMADILADARSAADREDARQASRDRREDVTFIDGEAVIHGARRSSWPESEYELDRQLRQAEDLHRELIRFKARTDYAGTLEATRAKSTAAATRSRQAYEREITR